MAQNIYDDANFFDNYNLLPRSINGLDGAPEWPTLRTLIGDVKDASILDIGCGLGWFCRWAVENGARSVEGVDISTKMLEKAKSLTIDGADGTIKYRQADLESIELEEGRYDLVYSSLALHYLPELPPLFKAVAESLKSDGRFIFSVEHPVMVAPRDPTFKKDENGNVFWPLNQYIDEGERITNWLGNEKVRKYHHTVESYVMGLIDAGFGIEGFRESWDGMERTSVKDMEDWGGHRPFFLIIAAQKRGRS
ncbi:methyltransferase type 11 [Microthyrium microscopicum]|uniref:Methyltransferase type 11 n=1 Tax=Microthyrium microscopicum TaxID=703497 RepID=A0A6A6UGV4_9PEZI|nr:methyltransferase type 11 [Microthyrium microscopicum]